MATSGATHFELVNGSVTVPLMLWAPKLKDGFTPDPEALRTFDEALVSSRADTPVSEWLETTTVDDLSGGFGVDYSSAAGLDTFSSPGYVLPGGAATGVTLPATNNSASPLVAFCDFQGDLFISQKGTVTANSARVIRSVAGTGAFADSLNLGAGQYMRDLVVADDGAGTKALWASSSDVNGASGRMHKWDGATWTSYAVYGTNGRNRMKVPHWVDEDGIGAIRIFTVSSNQGHVSYLKPYADPGLALSWVEGVRTGVSQAQPELASARGHVWIATSDGLYDIDEQGNSPNLTSYSENHAGGGTATEYLDGWVYYNAGAMLDRVRVVNQGELQENPGSCGPGYLTKTKSPWAVGYTTALKAWRGGMLAAQYCPGLGASGIFWGKDRTTYQNEAGGAVDTANPLVWHGPFAHTSAQEVVTRMHVTSVATAPTVSRLYAAAWNVSQVANPTLTWISLPAIGGARAGLVAGADHRYALGVAGATTWQPYARLELLPDDGGSKASVKDLYQIIYGTEGFPTSSPGGTDPFLTVSTRADPTPTSTTWGTTQNVTLGPTQTITPATTRGQKIEQRIDFLSPNGTATPPKPAILDSVEILYFKTVPDLNAISIDVEYGPGVLRLTGGDWSNEQRNIDWYDDALIDMAEAGRIQLRTTEDKVRFTKLKQKLDRQVTVTPNGLVKRATIVLADLGPA